jgi:sterol desaturase/sphingolipid hydroxylase (fatty acid hydroxylase superfamily)
VLDRIEDWIVQLDSISLFVAVGLMSLETLVDFIRRREPGRRLLHSLVSLSTQVPYLAGELLFTTAAVLGYFAAYEFITPIALPVTPVFCALALLAADFTYYWEHRLAHQVRLLWVSHAVHHSARIMNTAVSLRFGLLESPWAALMHLPLVMLGLHPLVVIAAQVAVLAYQTWIHTELIGRLGPLDAFLNTPSNHRVHHGCDGKYLDRNYGGILIIWDRIFGTYQAEEEPPRYGLARDFDSLNPVKIWFSEVPGLVRDLAGARSLGEVRRFLFGRPGWRPARDP